MKNYKALLFHPSGDYTTDFRNRQEIQEVWDEIENLGSKWIFYPITFVCTEKTVIDTPEGMEFLKGKRIKTAINYLKEKWNENADEICDSINSGVPFKYIYS